MARGTLIWDAAFSEQERKPFVYKEAVPWCQVAQVLNALFVQNTERGLTREQLNYLARMAFKVKKDEDFDNKLITEKQVIRERLQNRDFSFWKWFWANMNLIKTHVKTEWKDGLIYGFISKEEAKRKLVDSPCGTFLLRFSESNIENSQKSDICGYLTLAVTELDPDSGQKKLFHVKEYLSPKDLHERGLAPILDAMEVKDYSHPGTKKRLLKYLWPDTNHTFEMRFQPYIHQRELIDDGYKSGKYSIEIFLADDQNRRCRQDSIDGDGMSSYPNTPASGGVMSPASSAMSPAGMYYADQDPGLDMSGIGLDDVSQMIPLQVQQRQMVAVRPFPQPPVQPVPPIPPGPNPFFPLPPDFDPAMFNDQDLAAWDQFITSFSAEELHIGLDAENDMVVQNHR